MARVRAELGDDDIAIGGARLAVKAAAEGLIAEYRVRVRRVLVDSGTPFVSRAKHRTDLEFVDRRMSGSGVAYLRYRLVR